MRTNWHYIYWMPLLYSSAEHCSCTDKKCCEWLRGLSAADLDIFLAIRVFPEFGRPTRATSSFSPSRPKGQPLMHKTKSIRSQDNSIGGFIPFVWDCILSELVVCLLSNHELFELYPILGPSGCSSSALSAAQVKQKVHERGVKNTSESSISVRVIGTLVHLNPYKWKKERKYATTRRTIKRVSTQVQPWFPSPKFASWNHDRFLLLMNDSRDNTFLTFFFLEVRK